MIAGVRRCFSRFCVQLPPVGKPNRKPRSCESHKLRWISSGYHLLIQVQQLQHVSTSGHLCNNLLYNQNYCRRYHHHFTFILVTFINRRYQFALIYDFYDLIFVFHKNLKLHTRQLPSQKCKFVWVIKKFSNYLC